MQRLDIQTLSGYQVPLFWLPAGEARASIVLMAALGIAARFYLPLAQGLQAVGLNVALVEQRGHGESRLRPSRDVNFGFREALLEDIPAVLAWGREQAPGLPVYLMGHSLGGHYAAVTAGRIPQQVAGVILAGCGSPWVGGFSGKIQCQLRLLCQLIPLSSRLAGYYPGDRIGFGGREARTLMSDWLGVAKTNRYQAANLYEDLEAGIRRYTGPVLSLRLADDAFAPEAAMAAVTDKFVSARVTKVVISAADLGDKADHYRWARTPAEVVRQVDAWLAAALPS